jgi:hypothetical protein
MRKVARCRTHWVISKRNDLPTTLCTTLDSVNPVLYPSIDTILIKLCFVNHASSKRSHRLGILSDISKDLAELSAD